MPGYLQERPHLPIKPSQKRQFSKNVLHAAVAQERNQLCPPVGFAAESPARLSSGIPRAAMRLPAEFYSFCRYFAS